MHGRNYVPHRLFADECVKALGHSWRAHIEGIQACVEKTD